MTTQRKAFIFLALAGVFWSSGGALIKYIDWHPMAIAGGRSIIAALLIWLILCRGKNALTFSKQQLLGGLACCGMLCFYVLATKLTTAANAVLLQYTAPVYVALLSGWLLAEKTTTRDWITIFFVFGGILFFFVDKVTSGGLLGNMCGVASGVSFAAFTISIRNQRDGSPYGSILLGNLLTFLISLFFWQSSFFTVANLTAITTLGAIQLALPYILYVSAVKHVKALDATLITSIEPILNPLWVFLFMGETPGFYAMVGGLIVISTLIIRCWFDALATQDNDSSVMEPEAESEPA